MAREFSRTQRLKEQIQRECAIIFQREMKDPRLALTTISGVDLSRDLRYANVHVTFLNQQENTQELLQILNKASGFVRSTLSKRIRVRNTPELRFHYDNSMLVGRKMSDLIDQAIQSDEENHPDPKE